MARRKTTEEFIEDAKAVHGDKYDYSKVEYINSGTKVCLICPTHGEFMSGPRNHIHSSAGCPSCGGTARSTSEGFVRAAKLVHGERYDYSKVEYETNKQKVTLTCPTHGDFRQIPNNHLDGRGCPHCARNTSSTSDFVIRALQVHGEQFDYSNARYVDNRTKVTITCPTHGDFWQLPSSHISGNGCPKCFCYTGRTIVYLVHIESHGEAMLKVGITNFEVSQRFNDRLYPDQHVTEIATLEFKDRQDAKTIEAYLHAKHKKHQFTPKVKFGGHTECFNIEALETIKKDFGV